MSIVYGYDQQTADKNAARLEAIERRLANKKTPEVDLKVDKGNVAAILRRPGSEAVRERATQLQSRLAKRFPTEPTSPATTQPKRRIKSIFDDDYHEV